MLIKDDDWLGPLVGLHVILSRELLELLEHLRLLFYLLRELQHMEPCGSESILVQVLSPPIVNAREILTSIVITMSLTSALLYFAGAYFSSSGFEL